MPERRVPLLVTQALVMQAALALLCGTAVAGDPRKADPEADAELLEFLGSVDSGADSQAAADDGSWIDYLAQTDIGKVAKTANPNDASRTKNATGTQSPAPGPPAPGEKKND